MVGVWLSQVTECSGDPLRGRASRDAALHVIDPTLETEVTAPVRCVLHVSAVYTNCRRTEKSQTTCVLLVRDIYDSNLHDAREEGLRNSSFDCPSGALDVRATREVKNLYDATHVRLARRALTPFRCPAPATTVCRASSIAPASAITAASAKLEGSVTPRPQDSFLTMRLCDFPPSGLDAVPAERLCASVASASQSQVSQVISPARASPCATCGRSPSAKAWRAADGCSPRPSAASNARSGTRKRFPAIQKKGPLPR